MLCSRAIGHELLARLSLVRSRFDVETDAGNRSIRSAAFGLLATRQNHTYRASKSFGAATGKQQPMADHTSSGSGKGSSVCALRLFIGSDIIYTIPKHQDHVPVAITVATEQCGC